MSEPRRIGNVTPDNVAKLPSAQARITCLACGVRHTGFHRTRDGQSYFSSMFCREHGLARHEARERQYADSLAAMKQMMPEAVKEMEEVDREYERRMVESEQILVNKGLLPPREEQA